MFLAANFNEPVHELHSSVKPLYRPDASRFHPLRPFQFVAMGRRTFHHLRGSAACLPMSWDHAYCMPRDLRYMMRTSEPPHQAVKASIKKSLKGFAWGENHETTRRPRARRQIALVDAGLRLRMRQHAVADQLRIEPAPVRGGSCWGGGGGGHRRWPRRTSAGASRERKALSRRCSPPPVAAELYPGHRRKSSRQPPANQV